MRRDSTQRELFAFPLAQKIETVANGRTRLCCPHIFTTPEWIKAGSREPSQPGSQPGSDKAGLRRLCRRNILPAAGAGESRPQQPANNQYATHPMHHKQRFPQEQGRLQPGK